MIDARGRLAARLLSHHAGLNRRQGNGMHDIVNLRPARQVVHRFAQSLQHRPQADPVGTALHRFVRGVAGIQVRKTNTVARPATGLSGASSRAIAGLAAASYCSGPSITSACAAPCARRVASRTLPTSSSLTESLE